ncbi:MAG: PAS domain S-box protein, partial [Proteobacteria bacterium]|nr:PAS domain S-box protein [Pseudomonadota bacterium]
MQKPSGIDQIPDPSGASEFLRIADHWHEDSGSSRNQNATERALRESEDRYRLLVDRSLAGTLVTRGAETLFASRRLAEIFGYDIDEFNSLHSIYEIVAPADRERLKRYEESRLIGKPAPDRYEFQGLRKDGAPIWVEISVGIVPWENQPAIQATIIDVSERKLAEQALNETADQYRALVEGSIEGVLIRLGEKPVFVN